MLTSIGSVKSEPSYTTTVHRRTTPRPSSPPPSPSYPHSPPPQATSQCPAANPSPTVSSYSVQWGEAHVVSEASSTRRTRR